MAYYLISSFFTEFSKNFIYDKSYQICFIIDYAAKQPPYLIQFLNDPEITLSNNIAERHIKTAVMGCKNYLFSSNFKGARANTVMSSLIESAKANWLNLQW